MMEISMCELAKLHKRMRTTDDYSLEDYSATADYSPAPLIECKKCGALTLHICWDCYE